jgi:hypothetical protein
MLLNELFWWGLVRKQDLTQWPLGQEGDETQGVTLPRAFIQRRLECGVRRYPLGR